jgi:hypothetical protein
MRRSKVKTRGFWANRREAVRRFSQSKTWEEWSAERLEHGLRIEVDSARSWCSGWRQTVEFEWSEVSMVVAYKSDELTSDTIWLEFKSEDGDSVALPENAPEWNRLASDLPIILEGCQGIESWYARVSQPPFETSHTVLYGGSPSQGRAS